MSVCPCLIIRRVPCFRVSRCLFGLWLVAWNLGVVCSSSLSLCADEARGSSFIRKAARDHGASHDRRRWRVSETSSENARPRHVGSPSPRAQRQAAMSPSRSRSLLPGPLFTWLFGPRLPDCSQPQPQPFGAEFRDVRSLQCSAVPLVQRLGAPRIQARRLRSGQGSPKLFRTVWNK